MELKLAEKIIGKTPLIDVSYLSLSKGVKIYAKCEFMNPGQSFKDRMALYLILHLEKASVIQPGDTLVCASSGNTGCSIAMIGAIRGYKVIVTTSQKCSIEKQTHIRKLGAELIVVNPEEDYVVEAKKIADAKGYYNIDQYNNKLSPLSYYHSLGPELYQDFLSLDLELTHFVMSGSSFGCIMGVSKSLKSFDNRIQTILADPDGSNIYNYFYHLPIEQEDATQDLFKIDGAGKKEPTGCLDFSLIDNVLKVKRSAALDMCHEFSKVAGLMLGGSSGLNLLAAKELSRESKKNTVIATVLCDVGLRYLSTIYA